jgi:hypothetical protein
MTPLSPTPFTRRKRTRMDQRGMGLALGALLLLSACAGPNVRQGSAAYPVENPAPQRVVTVSGTVPPELAVSFEALWKPESRDPSCAYHANAFLKFEGVSSTFSVRLPLAAQRDGERITLPVAVDHYLPGACEWGLRLIEMTVLHRDGLSAKVDIFNPYSVGRAAKTLDVWCAQEKSPRSSSKDRLACAKYRPGPLARSDQAVRLSLEGDPTSAVFHVHWEP